MDDILVIGAGPAGLMSALAARQRGAQVRVLATGIGATHILPGWIGVLDDDLQQALERWVIKHPEHPYALAGVEALRRGVALLREVCAEAGINYVGDLSSNLKLPTALGAIKSAALAPASFAAGDVRTSRGAMLIASPRGWRDFYPALCAENLKKQGIEARGVTFDLPQMRASSRFDSTPVGLARLFDRPEVRADAAAQIKPQLNGAVRVGLPAILGLEHSAEAWRDMQERLGAPVFEIPTLPPSVPGIRLFNAFKQALARTGVQVLLEMTVSRSLVENGRATGVAVQNVAREKIYRAGQIVLATGGLYGGGIVTDRAGAMREAIFGLPLKVPGEMGGWFNAKFLSDQEHPIHTAGVRANSRLQPVDERGRVVLENVRIAGRLLANYAPLAEGSTEGVILATAYRATSDE